MRLHLGPLAALPILDVRFPSVSRQAGTVAAAATFHLPARTVVNLRSVAADRVRLSSPTPFLEADTSNERLQALLPYRRLVIGHNAIENSVALWFFLLLLPLFFFKIVRDSPGRRSRFYVHLPKDRSESVNECIGLYAPVEG
jgi:hypothetical protein